MNNFNNMNILLKNSAINAPLSSSNINMNANMMSNSASYSPTSSGSNCISGASSSNNSKMPLGLVQNHSSSLNDGLNSFTWNRNASLNNVNNNSINNSLLMMQKASALQLNQHIQQQQQQQQQPTCNLNNTLFVGNLHASLQEIDLIQVFRPFGNIVECCKKWLHFGFVKFITEEEACHAYVTLNGFRLKGRPMRLEFQNRTKKVCARFKFFIVFKSLSEANLVSLDFFFANNSHNFALG
jgi:hypothetical protein